MDKMGGGGALTLSSTSSMLKSLPSPRELLHVRMLLLLVTRARIVHLGETEETELNCDSGPTHLGIQLESRFCNIGAFYYAAAQRWKFSFLLANVGHFPPTANSTTSTVLKYKKNEISLG